MEGTNNLNAARVMIVDDAGIIRMTVSRILEKEGYHVYEAEDGLRALAMMEESSPDALLLDLKMPVMTGLDLLRVLKSEWPDTEVIVITAYAEDQMVRQVEELGVMQIVTKPFTDLSLLKKFVARAVVETRLSKGKPIEDEAPLRQVLLLNGRVRHEDFEKALSRSRGKNQSLKSVLIEQGNITEAGLQEAVKDFIRNTETSVPDALCAGTM